MDSYFQGKTEATIDNLHDQLNRMEKDLKEVKKMVEGLNYFKAKISGIAIGSSFVFSILLRIFFH